MPYAAVVETKEDSMELRTVARSYILPPAPRTSATSNGETTRLMGVSRGSGMPSGVVVKVLAWHSTA